MTSFLASLTRKFSTLSTDNSVNLNEVFIESTKSFENEDDEFERFYPKVRSDAIKRTFLDVYVRTTSEEERSHHVVLTIIRGKRNKKLRQYSLHRNTQVGGAIVRFEQYKPHLSLFSKVPAGREAFEWLTKLTSTIRNRPLWSSVHIAAELGIDSFLNGNDLKVLDEACRPEGLSPLLIAAKNGRKSSISKLLSLGADLKISDILYNDVLHNIEDNEEILSLVHKRSLQNRADYAKGDYGRQQSSVAEGSNSPLLNALTQYACNLSEMEKIVSANSEALREINALTGDTILHKATQKRSLLSLLELKVSELNVNQKNHIGQTPLHLYAQQGNTDLIIVIFAYWADVNTADNFGNTPLHVAVANCDLMTTKLLLCLGANASSKNKNGESARHIAAKTMKAKDLIYMLVLRGAEPCPSDMDNCRPGCINAQHQGAWAMHEDIIPRNISYGDFSTTYEKIARIMCDPYAHKITQALKQDGNEWRDTAHKISMQRLAASLKKQELGRGSRVVNVLSLDGGGVKGFVLVQVLLSIEELLDRPLSDYFSWIAATSTGSCVGASATVGNSVREGQRIYFRFKDDVFGQKIRPYNALTLEKFYQRVFGMERTLDDVKESNKFFCTVTKADVQPTQLCLQRNYNAKGQSLEYGNIDPRESLIWKAVRRSCAAPTYFSAAEGKYLDGGLMSNNPTLDLLSEIHHWNTNCEPQERVRIGCVLSIGTGHVEPRPVDSSQLEMGNVLGVIKGMKNLISMVMEQVTSSSGPIVTRGRAWAQSIGSVYYRLCPPLSKDYAMDTCDDVELINMMWDCIEFAYSKRELFAEIAEVIKSVGVREQSKENDIQTETETPSAQGFKKYQMQSRYEQRA